ncbi:MAG: hypothetical protein QJR14_09055 [Bacillota bacterium]|nr:hypothetical protein [Bacillota bacterium]
MATTEAGFGAVTADLEKMVQDLRSQRGATFQATYRLADSWAVAFRFQPEMCEVVERRLDIHAREAVFSARADAVGGLEKLGQGSYRLRFKAEPGEMTIQPDRYPEGAVRTRLLES